MNPFLKKLGFGPRDRVAIVHADDLGMCHATVPAIEELFAAGLVSSAAVMVPCPWFPAAAELGRRVAGIDIGVHATLTCEWMVYRWGPLSTLEPAAGLTDADGYFPQTTAGITGQVTPEAALAETRAQIERALAAGIDVTHIDSHMGASFDQRLIDGYLALAQEFQVPAMVPRMSARLLEQRGLSKEDAEAAVRRQAGLEEQGILLVDALGFMPLDQHEDRVGEAKRQFDQLPAGLTHFILHPAADTPELRAIAPDWRARVADYEAFCSAELREYVQSIGVHVIGYRALRDIARTTN
jgi:predicted glycoside hydrolase/deacetylase ChbG (UPF0249 family)